MWNVKEKWVGEKLSNVKKTLNNILVETKTLDFS